jgi:predicted adenylyl cyclase CyaB
MAANLEIKASLPDKDAAAAQARRMGAEHVGTLRQVDVYFKTASGRLKLRTIDGMRSELIFYERGEDADQRLSRFERYTADNPDLLRRMLETACGIRGVVEKERSLWMYGDTRIHIDEVRDLGQFLEIEVPVPGSSGDPAEIMRILIEGFQLAPGAYIRSSYIDLLTGEGVGTRPGGPKGAPFP